MIYLPPHAPPKAVWHGRAGDVEWCMLSSRYWKSRTGINGEWVDNDPPRDLEWTAERALHADEVATMRADLQRAQADLEAAQRDLELMTCSREEWKAGALLVQEQAEARCRTDDAYDVFVAGIEREHAEQRHRAESLAKALGDLLSSGFDDVDPRLDYINVQVDRRDWADAQAALRGDANTGTGERTSDVSGEREGGGDNGSR